MSLYKGMESVLFCMNLYIIGFENTKPKYKANNKVTAAVNPE